jgi:Zn-dependent M28 family amino/carboxypeptidase
VHWKEVQDLCAARFKEYGFEVELHAYGTGTNVIGSRPGGVRAEERILISAHYDHIPGCEGADDNATGVAAVFEAARVLAKEQFARTLVVACWDEEENGLVGSWAYAKRAQEQGEKIVAAYVFEMIGFKSEAPNSQEIPTGLEWVFPKEMEKLKENEFKADFIALVADEGAHDAAAGAVGFAAQFATKSVLLELTATQKLSPIFAPLRRSDHSSFWSVGIPAMMITDTANYRYKAYHCKEGPDTLANLDPEFASGVVRAIVASAAQMLDQ